MTDSSTTMLVLCGVAATVQAAVALWCYLRRSRMRAALAFSFMNVAVLFWHVGHFAETWASDLETKILWDSLQNIPYAMIAPAMLWVALDYLQLRAPRGLWPALVTVSAAIALPLATEPLHHLIRTDARLHGSPPMLTYSFGLFELGLSLVVYVSGLVASVLLLRGLGQVAAAYVPQRIALALALVSPILTTIAVSTLQLRIDGDRDLSPVTLTMGALLGVWGIARHGLFDLAPVARDTVIARLPDGVFVIDALGRVSDMNPAALALSGGSVGISYQDLFAAWPAVVALIDSGQTRTADVGPAPLARERFFEATCTQFTDERGHAGGLALVLRDVTAARERYEHLSDRVSQRTRELHETRVTLEHETAERHQVEAALAISETRFRTLFDQTFQLSGLLDKDGRLLAANRASLQMIDRDVSEVLGLPFWETPWWSHSELQQTLIRDGIERCARGEFVRFEASHPGPDGTPRRIDFSLTPILDAQGRVVEMVPEGRDVTALHEQRDRADLLAAHLERAQRLDSIGRMAGGLAHDFNNLLTVIGCSVELAGSKLPEGSNLRPHLDSIQRAADAAAEITRGLLSFGRQQPIAARNVDLSQVVHSTEKLIRRLIRANVRIEIEASEATWPVRADPAQLQQVVMNLILNAQDAMPSGGSLRVRTSNATVDASVRRDLPGARSGDFVFLEVIDTGTGMTEEVRARVFEPFFSTKEQGKGTGLGLAIVHGVVTQSGGFIDLRSTPGEGTSFGLYFPRAASEAASAAPEETSAPRAASQGARRTLIHVVEDQELLRRWIVSALEGAGHRVQSFGSARELLDQLTTLEAPDLLLTDIVMPDIHGLELADTLAKAMPNLRVLIMSGYADSDQVDLLSRLPQEAFLPKPFASTALASKVDDALRVLAPWSKLVARLRAGDTAPRAPEPGARPS